MSTFGEIVEPVSRTAWEDWDDIVPDRNTSELKWKQDLESPNEIETLLILEGKYLSECIKTQSQNNLDYVNSIATVNLNLYKQKTGNKFICTIKDYNILLSSEIVELLRQYLIVSNNVIAVQTKALAEYQATEMTLHNCVIRVVSTTKNSNQILGINFPKLEQPNIISGVSAGVITLREHQDQPGLALVCYMEHPEEYQIEEMENLLEKLNITQDSKSRPSTVLNSNLYI